MSAARQKVRPIVAARDLAERVVSGGKPVRSVSGETQLLASAVLAMDGALRAVAVADRSAPYGAGEARADGRAPEGPAADDAWATPREIAAALLGIEDSAGEVAHVDAG